MKRDIVVIALFVVAAILFVLNLLEIGKFFDVYKYFSIFTVVLAIYLQTNVKWKKPLILLSTCFFILLLHILLSDSISFPFVGTVLMVGAVFSIATDSTRVRIPKSKEPLWIKPTLIIIMFLFLAVFVFLPLYTIFSQAFAKGAETYFAAIRESDSWAAIKLTLLVASVCVPINTIFGILLAWAIAKFEFRGKSVITTLIEVPFAISPVIAGLIFILLFGSFGWFGHYLVEHNIKIVFAIPGLFLATAFITFPFVARELIPLMQEMGKDDEEAALTLGASGLQTFFKVTLPNIKWGLLYGIVLTNARAMGEFGAVAVVSGLIRGVTMTMPLHIEVLYNEYLFAAAFAVASLLTLLALVTLVVKTVIEHFIALQRKRAFSETSEVFKGN
ncbi:MAG: sulfate ABC transporter permease subunit CysW [Campylobacteraceae bacterium]|jgi:sulfate transport system permease protein|nr:sulfate ABC transporter permease subunit CysW [Campylobacteraceae bacterium]